MAVILESFVGVFLEKLGSVLQEEVSLLSGVRSELEAMEKKLRKIRLALADAERRALYNESIRVWLTELRDVMYDADDVLDDCRVEGGTLLLQGPADNPSSSSSSGLSAVRSRLPSSFSFLSKVIFRHRVGKRITGINARLEEIAKEKSQFQLATTEGAGENQATRISRQTSPVAGRDIVGVAVELHARSLISRMLVEEESREEGMVAITGMGGIGKTTLAQRIYNDQMMVGARFPIKMWICVSRNFDETSLLTQIITSAGGNPGNAQSRAQLEPMVETLIQEKKIEGKKLLLVLDDVWRADVWEDLLRKPLEGRAAGSKILVTTRFETVAREMGATHLHRVEKMSAEDGLNQGTKQRWRP